MLDRMGRRGSYTARAGRPREAGRTFHAKLKSPDVKGHNRSLAILIHKGMKWASHLLPGNPQRHLDTGKHFSLVPTGPSTEANARPLTLPFMAFPLILLDTSAVSWVLYTI